MGDNSAINLLPLLAGKVFAAESRGLKGLVRPEQELTPDMLRSDFWPHADMLIQLMRGGWGAACRAGEGQTAAAPPSGTTTSPARTTVCSTTTPSPASARRPPTSTTGTAWRQAKNPEVHAQKCRLGSGTWNRRERGIL